MKVEYYANFTFYQLTSPHSGSTIRVFPEYDVVYQKQYTYNREKSSNIKIRALNTRLIKELFPNIIIPHF